MQTDLKYIRKSSMSSILQATHNQMMVKLKREQKTKQAREIEIILQEVKRIAQLSLQHTTGSAILTRAQQQIYNIIENAWNEQKSKNSLVDLEVPFFRRQHYLESGAKAPTIGMADDIFEQELGFLIQAAAKIKKINIDIGEIIVGQESVKTLSMQNIPKELEKKVIDITEKALNNQVKSLKSRNNFKKNITARAGKIDIDTSSIKIEGNAEDEVSKILKAFSGGTFSVKNYSSKNKSSLSGIYIGLGNSNMYKGVTGALSEIFPNTDVQNHIYYRGMQILSGNIKASTQEKRNEIEEIVNKHFIHLRLIYEMRGSGLINTETGKNRIADFIIWNDPTSEKIAVRSTTEILMNEIFRDSRNSLFTDVRIAANRINTKK